MTVATDRVAILDFVRHGQTDYNKIQRIQGHLPIPLSELGVQQVTNLAETLKTTRYNLCYNSTFRRAEQSAEIIEGIFAKSDIQLKRVADARIRERERGAFSGKLETEFDAAPEADRLRETETDEALADRVFDFIHEKGPHHAGEQVLVVSHERVISRIILKLNPEKRFKKILVENTAVLRLAYTQGQASILSMKGITIETQNSG